MVDTYMPKITVYRPNAASYGAPSDNYRVTIAIGTHTSSSDTKSPIIEA